MPLTSELVAAWTVRQLEAELRERNCSFDRCVVDGAFYVTFRVPPEPTLPSVIEVKTAAESLPKVIAMGLNVVDARLLARAEHAAKEGT